MLTLFVLGNGRDTNTRFFSLGAEESSELNEQTENEK